MNDKRSQSLTNIRVDHDAEPKTILRDELNTRIEVIGEMRSRVPGYDGLPQVFGSNRHLRKIVAEIVDEHEDGLMRR